MDHPLDGPRFKLRVASNDLSDLKAEVSAFLGDRDVHSIIVKRDPETSETLVKARVTQAINPLWGVRVGCITHCLRSALDNLSWQLAILNLNGGVPFKRTAYPIFLEQSKFADGAKAKLRDITHRHRAMIEGTQPYSTGHGTGDPLWILHEMNNSDKHRVFTFVRATTSQLGYTFGTSGPDDPGGFDPLQLITTMRQPFVNGAILGRFKANVEVDTEFTLKIRFGDSDPVIKNRGVFHALGHIQRRVSEVVEMFAPEFARVSHSAPP